ncbi:MAG: MaoC family dehydratase [Actinobacteria bacterium]|nr:MaoC family dehydratase [Actinomycetota bacterium]
MPTVVDTLDGLTGLIGQPLEPSSWVEIDQQRIDAFAEATGDHQWIHTDPERAKDGPFGTTVAHGYLTLSLLIPMWTEILEVRSVATKVNYGLNKVRFPAPVPAGSKLRATATLAAVDPVPGGAQLTADVTVEIEGTAKPACVAQLLVRFLR